MFEIFSQIHKKRKVVVSLVNIALELKFSHPEKGFFSCNQLSRRHVRNILRKFMNREMFSAERGK